MVRTLPCRVCSSRSDDDARKEPSSENLIPCSSLPGGHGRPLPRDDLEQAEMCSPVAFVTSCGASLDSGPESNEFCSSDHCLHEVVGARFFAPACISSAVSALCPVPM